MSYLGKLKVDLKFKFDDDRFKQYLDGIKENIILNFNDINKDYKHYSDYLKDVIDFEYLVNSGIFSFTTDIINENGDKIEFS